MIVSVEGRKEKVNMLIAAVKKEYKFHNLRVEYPEAYRFCSMSGLTRITIEFCGNYFNFDLITNRKMKGLRVCGKCERFLFEKPKQYQKVFVKKQNRSGEESAPVFNYGESVEADEVEDHLGFYETMELYEERTRHDI